MKKLKTITPMIMILILVTACTPSNKKTVDASDDLDLDVRKLTITTENEIDKVIKDIVEKKNKTTNVDKKETDTSEKEKEELPEENKEESKPKVEDNKDKTVVEKTEQTKKKLSLDEIVTKVLNGEYGNGSDRRKKLEKEGYNYKEVQDALEKRLPKKPKANNNATEPNKPKVNNNNNNKTEPKEQTTNTNGFNFKGHHFSIANFSGSGHVPQETNNVYSWTSRPSHYLVERISPAGRVIRQVKVGDNVAINGQSYKVHTVRSGIPNDDNAYDVLTGTSAHITFQTCDTTKGANGKSDLTIWWANKL